MSRNSTANTKSNKDKFANLVGPTDPKIDAQARERLITSRVCLLLKQPFFGNLATRLKLVNADDWLPTAATDGLRFYYNSRFVMMLKQREVDFLVGHEVLHVVYDHMDRRGSRDPQIFNVACDYAVNADLKRHRVGDFITTVPCLYEQKYDGKSAEEIYDDLMKDAKKISMQDLIDQLLDDHMDGDGEDGDAEGDQDKDGKSKGKRPKMSEEERNRARQEIKQAIIAAAQSTEAGQLPANVARMIKDLTEPKMPWRELLQTNLTSAIKSDYSWMRPSRRSWHMDAIMPGMTPGEEIDVVVAIDTSGSISTQQCQQFLSEIKGMMEAFDGYKVHVFTFDTCTYNPQDYTSENLDDIAAYEPMGGGGTDFDVIFTYLKDVGNVPKRLIVFTDCYPCGSWGDPDYCESVLWVSHGNPNPEAPFGTVVIYDEKG